MQHIEICDANGNFVWAGPASEIPFERLDGGYHVRVHARYDRARWIQDLGADEIDVFHVTDGIAKLIPATEKLHRIKLVRDISKLTSRPLGLSEARDLIESL